jgi:hypothetical protein
VLRASWRLCDINLGLDDVLHAEGRGSAMVIFSLHAIIQPVKCFWYWKPERQMHHRPHASSCWRMVARCVC